MTEIRDCTVIDLFCGVGGLTHGFVKEGFTVVAGVDTDKSCKHAYEKNNGSQFIEKDIQDISSTELLKLFGTSPIKILVGCAPCQPFSTYNQKKYDDKWKLVYEFINLIEETKPDIVSMENLPRLTKFKEGTVFNNFISQLQKLDYAVTWQIVYSPDYGVPQKRSRLVVLASRFGKIDLLEKTHTPDKYMTLWDTIGSLEPIHDGEQSDSDPLHRAAKLLDTNKERIKSSAPGGTWRDWGSDLVAPCHTKTQGKSYFAVYGRMSWDEPSPTITTQSYNYGSGRFGHPEQDRALSLREAALLQTFPHDYEFCDKNVPVHLTVIGRHIGNAVPVALSRVIARSIAKHIEALNAE